MLPRKWSSRRSEGSSHDRDLQGIHVRVRSSPRGQCRRRAPVFAPSRSRPYSRRHGRSFKAEIFLRGEPDPKTGWVVDFAEVDRQLQALRNELDHNYLNDIEGLSVPTLENISRWIFNRLDNVLPGLDRVLVRRGTCGEGCLYRARPPQPMAYAAE